MIIRVTIFSHSLPFFGNELFARLRGPNRPPYLKVANIRNEQKNASSIDDEKTYIKKDLLENEVNNHECKN